MNKKVSFIAILSIMSIFFFSMAAGGITPAMNIIWSAFPSVSITTLYLISTLPSLTVIPTTIITGMIVGKKIKYKTLAALGLFLFAAAGIAPSFTNNFGIILIERAIVGIGLGLIAPLGNILVISMFEGDKRASLLGWGTILMNAGLIVLQLLTGYLADMSWKYSFYPHAVAVLSLILVIVFLPEPEKVEQAAGAEKPKVKLQGSIWMVIILFGVTFLLLYPTFIGMSPFLAIKSLGGSTQTAIVLMFYTGSGMIGGAIFGAVYKLLKRFTIAVASLLSALGYALVIFGGKLILIEFGMALLGVGFALILPTVFMIIGMSVKPHEMAMASSLAMASLNLFGFLSTYWIGLIGNITGDAIVMPMVAGMIIYAAGGLLFLIVNPFPKIKSSAN